jgi:benzylsuccinate CoA-transferase BbsF subunit
VQQKLLEGIRVVDFTWHLTGPLTTKALSDCGAEVIRVESRRAPDIQRLGARYGSFNQYNSGKLSVTLNVSTPRGLELVKQLIARADVVVENFAGGAIQRMGLGYEVLKEIKPDIIMVSSCMQGQTGPCAKHPGSGHKLTALAGISHITGWPDRQPGWVGAYTDFIAPRYNIIAILAALDYRRRTGKGQYLDISQYEATIQFMTPLLLDYALNGHVAYREGNHCAYAAPYNAYRCRGEDRWCAISVDTDEEWESFCRVIGNPGLASDPRFATLLARKENEDELDGLIEEWTISHTSEEVVKLMQEAGVAAGVVQTGQDLLDNDPHLKARHFFWEIDHPECGRYRTQTGLHCLLSNYTCDMKRAPLMGEQNESILKGELGLTDEEFDRMVKEEVIY